MDLRKESSSLINAVNQVNVNCAPDCMCLLMTVVWQRHAGKRRISSSWPETVQRSFTPNEKRREAADSQQRSIVSVFSKSWYIRANGWQLKSGAETWRSLFYPSSHSFHFPQKAQTCTYLNRESESIHSLINYLMWYLGCFSLPVLEAVCHYFAQTYFEPTSTCSRGVPHGQHLLSPGWLFGTLMMDLWCLWL